MLPPLNEQGLLPPGIHEGSFEEIREKFGSFQSSDQRPQLWSRLAEFIRAAKASSLIKEIVLNGSFVTAKPDPNDIDMIAVVAADHDFDADLPPYQYNLLAARRVRSRFGFDIVVVRNGSEQFNQAIEFFVQVRQKPGLRKGLLRIKL